MDRLTKSKATDGSIFMGILAGILVNIGAIPGRYFDFIPLGTVALSSGPTLSIVYTYYSIKDTKGARERTFIRRYAVIYWITVISYCGLLFIMPEPYKFSIIILYIILLLISSFKIRKKYAREFGESLL